MYRYTALTAGMTMLILSASATAQSDVDQAFTATAASCDRITWSRAALEKYPKIASACQEVMQRDGRFYVKFSGTVRRVRGEDVTVNFKDGSELTLTPPENMSLYIDGRQRTVRSLRRGDELTFYVPQENVVAPPPRVVGVTVIPITRLHLAEATPADTAAPPEEPAEHEAPALPATASVLPLIGFSGLVLTLLGITPTRRRRR